MPRDDELAQTATAPGAPIAESDTVPSGRGSARDLAPPKLGRFELESILGAGGMGVVHAAFDPELERRVAVKVLRGKNADARTRLLREARAMAKLSHENVITVFDVGSADGEDFVAMELIEGGTLGDWIERTQPRPREIIAAFVAAGRGVAAAHAEGLVHRDFKPSNVLRSRSGRIVVTDFGLARAEGADGRPSRPAIDQKQEITAQALTKTGSLLGTPAYMAPEQWRAEAVTPATDQFAFCVSLWEALTGKRPFGGDTLEDLKTDVLEGPVDLDDTALPRKLRPVLRRGLALDPAERWPSMTTLLDAIERASSRRTLAVVAGAGLAATGVVVYLASGSAAVAPSCVQPAIDPDTVTLTPGAQPYVEQWRAARETACEAPREVRVVRLACLDAVFARIADAFHERTPGPDAVADLLVSPEVCATDRPPHLVGSIDGRLSKAFAVLARARDSGKAIDSELAGETQPACAQVVALLARSVGVDPDDSTQIGAAFKLLAQIDTALPSCEDDAIKAQATLDVFTGEPDKLPSAELAAKQFPSDANLAAINAIRANAAYGEERYTDAFAGYDAVLASHVTAGRKQAELDTAFEIMQLRLEHSHPEDLDAILVLADRYRARSRDGGREPALSALDARARWRLGQVEAANREARATAATYRQPSINESQFEPQNVKGTVVDDRGNPVANAKVVSAVQLMGDDAELCSPVAGASATPVETLTKADGSFELVGARKMAMAILGDQVSVPLALKPGMTLRLGPTSTIEGDVALGTEANTRVRVMAFVDGNNERIWATRVSPVDRNGHFKLTRVPRGKRQIDARRIDDDETDTVQKLDVTVPAVTGVHLGLRATGESTNPLYIVGRSETETAPDTALAFVFQGHPKTAGTVRDVLVTSGRSDMVALTHHTATQLAPAFKGHVQTDDLTAEQPKRPDGDLTICAVGLSKKLLATITSPDQAMRVIGDGAVGCTVLPANESLATVPIPAIKRR